MGETVAAPPTGRVQFREISLRTVARMVAAGSLTGFVDWDEIAAKLIPVRPRRQ